MVLTDREEVRVETVRVKSTIEIEDSRASSCLDHDLDLDNEDERASWAVETYPLLGEACSSD